MRRICRIVFLLSLTAALGTPAAGEPGNADAGEDVFKKCRACHDTGPGAKHKVGPQLTGIIGRKVGSMADYTYSDANKDFAKGGGTWTEDELFKYLENPLVYMPKTKMAFAGVKDEQDRRDLIAYLKQFQ